MDKNNLGVPIAIVVAGLIIAGAIMFGGNGRSLNLTGGQPSGTTQPSVTTTSKIPAVTSKDHLQGVTGAPVTVVEYSDLECPFCKMFHQTMKEAMGFYNGGEEVKLAWVFRHFPLDNLHSKARSEAQAAECAGELGGNNAFWAYVDKVFSVTPSNNGLDLGLLPAFATEIGLDRTAFESCLAKNAYANKIQASYDEAIASGGQGTPFVIVIGPNGEQTVLPGAVPLADLQKAIDQYLK